MAERRITCWQCSAYDRTARRCGIGKTNPKSKADSLTVAELLGAQALCLHNPFREPLLLRMRQPDRRFVWAAETPRQIESALEIEIIDEETAY